MRSPVLLPEIISIISSYLHKPQLAVAARINRTWSNICLPILYHTISVSGLTFKINSLEIGVLRNGHYCQVLITANQVNHWCPRIVSILRSLPNLIELHAPWMNADLLESLIYLQKLERLSISRLQGSQSEDNSYFEPSFQGSRRIRELCMADSNQMTDMALVNITKACPRIQVLVVSGNRCLTHEGLIQWCQHLSEPINCSGSVSSILDNLSIDTNPKISTAMTELTIVNFSNCNRIQSIGFQALFERSRHLEDVNLMSTGVEDSALQALVSQNKGLKNINLNCCAAITDRGLQTILRTCNQLRAVSFLYCNRITAQVFFQDLWKCVDLQELQFSLNRWHVNLIENGQGGPIVQNGDNGNQDQDQESLQENLHQIPFPGNSNHKRPAFSEPQLELMIFGEPELKDFEPNNTIVSPTSITTETNHDAINYTLHAHAASATTIQGYRQRLILSQIYRQIEQLVCLQTLDIRDFHLPLDIASGLERLGRLKQLEILRITGLEWPMGMSEVDWLMGKSKDISYSNDVQPLPSLQQLVFKKGYGFSTGHLSILQEFRPQLKVELTQVVE
ncbi:Transcription factor COE1 [Haplosporangium sp. Z 27]|nr:Transcription factor COE1 [Haplosporangium sp. Z 27]